VRRRDGRFIFTARTALAIAAVLIAIPTLPVAAAQKGDATQAGQRVFREGVGRDGPLVGIVGAGAFPLSGAAIACANCHGDDALGRPEGGVTPPAITWHELTKPYGHVHANDRKHGPFTEATFLNALREGRDPAGNTLDSAMPRYMLSADDATALVAYLKKIEKDIPPGISATSLRLATLLPREGPLAAVGATIEKTLAAALADYNARSGVHGRRLELDVLPASGKPGADIERLRRAQMENPYFAIISPVAIGIEESLGAFAEERQIPMIGAFSPGNPGGRQGSNYVFDLMSGLPEQGRTLIEHAIANLGLKDPRAVVLFPEGTRHAEAVEALHAHATQRGWKQLERSAYASGALDSAATVARLRKQRVEAVFYFGGESALADLLRAADREKWYPPVLAIGAEVARVALAMPAGFAGRLHLVFPNQPGGSGPAHDRYRQFLARHALPRHQITAEASAYAAVELLTEGLKRAGRVVNRRNFVESLEGVRDFDTGALPPLSYGPSHRVGARGGYVVTYDPAAGGFKPLSGWIAIDLHAGSGG